LNAPPLALWTGLFARMLISKDRHKLVPLIVISIFMIIYSLGSIVYYQLNYTYNVRNFNGDLNHIDLANQML
jgi:hypothetical protein